LARNHQAKARAVFAREPGAFVVDDLPVLVVVDVLAKVVDVLCRGIGGEEIAGDLDQLAVLGFLLFEIPQATPSTVFVSGRMVMVSVSLPSVSLRTRPGWMVRYVFSPWL
jgi:hypothetical protein